MQKLSKIVLIVFTVSLLWLAVSRASQNSTSHTVKIVVEPVDHIEIQGGDMTFNFQYERGTEDQITMLRDTQSSCRLQWNIISANRKITVASDHTSPDHTLTVEAAHPSTGVAHGRMELDAAYGAQDLLTGVGKSTGHCDLRYTVQVHPAGQKSVDTHHITYTIVAE